MAEALDKLHPSTGGVGDACWHLSGSMEPSDPVALIDMRHRQKARLARYGRQDWGSWDDRLVTEMDVATIAIMKLVAQENEALEGG